MNLVALMRDKARAARDAATATTATAATARTSGRESVAAVAKLAVGDPLQDPAPARPPEPAVASVATVAVAMPKAQADASCWPDSVAANSREIYTMQQRLALLAARGMEPQEAELLADRLMARDRDGDDRRLCMECFHLVAGASRNFCSNSRQAQLPMQTLAKGWPLLLQRCPGFVGTHLTAASTGSCWHEKKGNRHVIKHKHLERQIGLAVQTCD